MSFCVKCGSRLRDGVCFCEKCGFKVSGDDEVESDGTEDVFDEDVEPEVEDCDAEPEKGPPSDCYATFDGREVIIHREDGSLYRRFTLHYEVLAATVSGDVISITCEGGWHYLYTLDGTLIRSGRH